MGTRADFYMGRGEGMKWLGSIAYDGYPSALRRLFQPTEEQYMLSIVALSLRPDWTRPEQGWPWPWKDSRTTDYAYTWHGGVLVAAYGRGWFGVAEVLDPDFEAEREGPMIEEFPDMTAVQNVTLGPRSGVLVLK